MPGTHPASGGRSPRFVRSGDQIAHLLRTAGLPAPLRRDDASSIGPVGQVLGSRLNERVRIPLGVCHGGSGTHRGRSVPGSRSGCCRRSPTSLRTRARWPAPARGRCPTPQAADSHRSVRRVGGSAWPHGTSAGRGGGPPAPIPASKTDNARDVWDPQDSARDRRLVPSRIPASSHHDQPRSGYLALDPGHRVRGGARCRKRSMCRECFSLGSNSSRSKTQGTRGSP